MWGQAATWWKADGAHVWFHHLWSVQDLGPVYGVILTAALSASGVGAQWTHRMREHLTSWGGWHPHKGAGWGMLTILLVGLIAEGSELLIQGFQWDAHGIVPALPGIEQQAIVS